jgi:hypothetical protein
MLSHHGVIIRRSTPCGWVASSGDLLKPLYNLICQRVRASRVLYMDDTGITKLAPGKCDNCKFWAYAGDAFHHYAAYEFSETRAGANRQTFFSGLQRQSAGRRVYGLRRGLCRRRCQRSRLHGPLPCSVPAFGAASRPCFTSLVRSEAWPFSAPLRAGSKCRSQRALRSAFNHHLCAGQAPRKAMSG